MVIFYMFLSCIFCCKVWGWLWDYQIFFIEWNIFVDLLIMVEIKNIFWMIENGIEDIILKWLKVYQSFKIDVDDLLMMEFYELICKIFGLLWCLIIIDDKWF